MEIHELNTNSLTNPAYVACDDGSDTYKLDLRALYSANRELAMEALTKIGNLNGLDTDYKNNLVGAINEVYASSSKPIIYYRVTNTAAGTAIKELSAISGLKEYDIVIVEFSYGSTSNGVRLQIGSYAAGYAYFNNSTSAPEIPAMGRWMFRVTNLSGTTPTFQFIGATPTSGGGGGSVTVDSALSTSSENPVQNKVITNNLPASASVSSGVISFKNGSGTTLFSVTLPVYNGGVS